MVTRTSCPASRVASPGPISAFTPADPVDDEMRTDPEVSSKRIGLSGEVSKTVGSRPSNSMKVWSTGMACAASRTAVAASLTSWRASMSTVTPPSAGTST